MGKKERCSTYVDEIEGLTLPNVTFLSLSILVEISAISFLISLSTHFTAFSLLMRDS
jgi:hypothetical protein